MSDTRREPEPIDGPTSDFTAGPDDAAEPVTGAPAGAAASTGDAAPGTPDPTPATGATGATPATPATGDAGRPGRGMFSLGPVTAGQADERQRRRRRWFLIGISVAAAIVLVALCAGALSVISAVGGVRDRAADARDARELRETDCRDLETRLNQLLPPGATTSPAARSTAIRDENTAVRLYLDRLAGQREEDAWRQLLDARTVFSDALDRQAKSRTPAFFVAPRTTDGLAVADQLERWSPGSCAGSIRRLAAPEL